jgi:periplasmic divalent cation tolerance protein
MVVLTTIDDSDKADQLARQLVAQKLAACVSISSPVKSVYRWKKKIETEMECQLIIKTRKTLYPAVELFIRENHPYDVPEIISFNIEDVASDYRDWLLENTESIDNPQ